MKKTLIISFILLFLALNIFSFRDYYFNYIWNKYFLRNDFNNAKNYFKESESKNWIYNYANTNYKLWKYDIALKKYLSILWENKSEFDFVLLHNIANTYYKLSLEDKQKEIDLLEKSSNYYQKALDIKYNEETKKNLEFVLEKIKKLKNKEDKKENSSNENDKNNNSQNTKNWDNNESFWSWNTNSWTWKDLDNSWTWINNNTFSWALSNSWTWDTNSLSWSTSFWTWVSNFSSWTQNEKRQELSKDMQDKLKAYEESLKQSQKQNQNQVWKVYDEQNLNDPFSQFDNFFGDPFSQFDNFDNSLKKDDNKKDW